MTVSFLARVLGGAWLGVEGSIQEGSWTEIGPLAGPISSQNCNAPDRLTELSLRMDQFSELFLDRQHHGAGSFVGTTHAFNWIATDGELWNVRG